jgi:hypothetical protein
VKFRISFGKTVAKNIRTQQQTQTGLFLKGFFIVNEKQLLPNTSFLFLSEFGIIVLLIKKKKKCNSRVMREIACSKSSLKGHELNFYFI